MIDAHSQPITVDFMYAIVDKPRKFSVFSNVLVTYGKNEQVKSDFTLELMNRLYTTKFNFNHPRISPISVESVIKELTLEKVNQQIFVTVGNKKYEAIQEIDRKSINPTYNLKIKYPNGETDTAKWSLDLTERDRAIWLVLVSFFINYSFNIILQKSDIKDTSEKYANIIYINKKFLIYATQNYILSSIFL